MGNKTISASVDDTLDRAIEEKAGQMKISKSEVITKALRRYIDLETLTPEQALERIKNVVEKEYQTPQGLDEVGQKNWEVATARRKITNIKETLERVY